MKNQYVGDINDYRKYDLLQTISDITKEKILIIWMLTQDDNRNDGKKIKYLNYPQKWKKYNEILFEELKCIVNDSRTVESIQKISFFAQMDKFEFYSNYINNDLLDREKYYKNISEKAKDSRIIFFDPDNGLAPKENIKNPSKYLFLKEIKDLWDRDKDILFCQFFPWYCNREKYTGSKIEELSHRLNISKKNIIVFNARSVVYLFLCHDIRNKNIELIESWKKWKNEV